MSYFFDMCFCMWTHMKNHDTAYIFNINIYDSTLVQRHVSRSKARLTFKGAFHVHKSLEYPAG